MSQRFPRRFGKLCFRKLSNRLFDKEDKPHHDFTTKGLSAHRKFISPLTAETFFVSFLLAATIVLFASELLRLDVVAVLVVFILILSCVFTTVEALGGSGNTFVLLISGVFVGALGGDFPFKFS